jgi:hypothetical protein
MVIPQADRLAIYHKIRDERVKELLSEEEIVMVAASPLGVEGLRGADGTTKIQRHRSSPQIAELKLKILDILQREGKSLIALNPVTALDLFSGAVIDLALILALSQN